MRGMILAALGAAACGSADAGGGGGANKPYTPKLPAAVDAQPMPDASTAAVDTTTPAVDWWKHGCPNGGAMQGDPPPKGDHVWCVRADNTQDGPEAYFEKGKLLSIGNNKDGRRDGGFVAFYPDGSKHRAGAYRAANNAGTWTTWWPNGKVQLEEHYVDGRADGVQTAYAADGKVVETWKLKMGTGTMTWWDDDGHKASETEYVDGRAHGASTSYYPSGKVQEKSRYVDGEPDGQETDYYENGQIREQGTYYRGRQIGDWQSFDDKGAQTQLVRRDGKGDELFEILYDGGQPLVPVPSPGPCDDNAAVAKAAGMPVRNGSDTPECVERPRHFPGIAVSGSFAYDAGCMDATWVVDCKKVANAPDSKAILARAGWPKAKGKLREALAQAYVEEISELWDGSLMNDPDPVKSVAAADGSVVVTAWTAPRPGMQYDPTITKVAWTFTADGAVSQKVVGTGKRK